MGSTTTALPIGGDLTLLQAQVAALAHRHITVAYTLIATVVFTLLLAGAGGWYGLRMFDAQLARMEAREQQYDAERKQYTDALAANNAQRAQQTAQQAAVTHTTAERDAQADKAIQAAVRPDLSLNTTAAGLQDAFKDVVGFGQVNVSPGYPDGLHGPAIELAGHQAQQITAYKIDRDRLFSDLSDLRTVYALEQTKNSSLSNDLAQCQDLRVKGDAVIAGYKSLAKRSKWQKFLSGAEKVGLLAAGIAIGRRF
jgi:Tfp pilus assembly protein FimV